MRLRTRLALAAALILTTVLVAGWAILHAVSRSQQDAVDRKLLTFQPPRDALDPAPGGAPAPRPRPTTATTTSTSTATSATTDQPAAQPFDDVYVARITADGTRVRLFAAADEAEVPETPVGGVDERGRPVISTVGTIDGGPRWRAALMTAPNGEQFLVAVSLAQADDATSQVRLAMLGVGGAIVLVLGLAGWWVVGLGLRPIAEVTQAADAIASGDRTRRVDLGHGRTEAGHLARAFNVMLDEHQAGEDRLRRFVADASHELRTPVAAIRGFADLYRAGALDDPAVLNDAMRRIGGESARMAGLVEDLLLLARLDEGRPLDRSPVDLGAVVHDTAFDATATHPTRTVTAEVTGELVVVGDDARLRQVVTNLVQNALIHGGPDARVVVRGCRDGDATVVEVADDGVGMATADVSLAFDRFWRADTARSRASAKGRATTGSGLGLSIVRAIVEAHGGTVSLDSAPDRGTTVRVVLPAA